MNVVDIPLDKISADERLRKVNEGHAALLADLIAAEGVKTPIEVRLADAAGMYRLIAGGHRLRAAELAGLKVIPAIVANIDEIDAQIREIEENLFRLDLGPLELGHNLFLRKQLHLRKHPRSRHGGDRRSDQFANLATWSRFTAEAAKTMKRSERALHLAMKRYEELAEVRGLLLGTPYAERGVDLDAIASMSVGDRLPFVELLLAEQCSVKDARAKYYQQPDVECSPREKQVAALRAAWGRAEEDARGEFLKEIGAIQKKGRGA